MQRTLYPLRDEWRARRRAEGIILFVARQINMPSLQRRSVVPVTAGYPPRARPLLAVVLTCGSVAALLTFVYSTALAQRVPGQTQNGGMGGRSEEHTSELQSRQY